MNEMNTAVKYLSFEIIMLCKKCDHKMVTIWASDCALAVIALFENMHPNDLRPRKAINSCIAWINNEMIVSQVRKHAFASHAAACRNIRSKSGLLC
jgi:hypothetical protein